MIDVDLFAGGGGLAVGLKQVGFDHTYLYELDHAACETLRYNSRHTHTLSASVIEGDVAVLDWSTAPSQAGLLAAGAPCQPFSLGGRHRAEKDGRNLFPEVFRAIRAQQPKAVLLENVKGLLRPSFRPYFEYILRQLEYPSLAPRHEELWHTHDERLRRQQCSLGYCPGYRVEWRLLDAADYGVPQNRQRVFIVATRADLRPFAFPMPTHTKQALIRAQADGSYWIRHGLRRRQPNAHNGLALDLLDDRLPWMTVRDALDGLPTASRDEKGSSMNHWAIPGARSYSGHVGSTLDLPSKTIKAGVHGVPGGENTLVDDNKRLRYFTLREIARLQTFPDEHHFVGARIHVTRQIGNAVPPRLAAAVGKPLYDLLRSARRSEDTSQ